MNVKQNLSVNANLIRNWADERGLTNGKPEKQFLKMAEEIDDEN